jgi:hypothetical protein
LCVWQVVLERGVMAYFACRADACSGVKRKDFKYLDGARIVPLDSDECSFLINFSDSTVHRLSVVNDGDDTQQISRQVMPLVEAFLGLFIYFMRRNG